MTNSIVLRFSFVLLAIFTQNMFAASEQLQPIESIEAAIKHFIHQKYKTTTDFTYSHNPLDPRLQLPLCENPITITSQTGSIQAGRNSIGISCDTGKKWTVFTVLQVKAYKNVLVLSQPVRRGEIIGNRHLTFKRKDIADLRQGYLTHPAQVINKQAKRHFAAGAVINSANFVEPKVIKRGEKVSIQAVSPYFNISMAGIALMDGRKGQNIRVKNINSKRIIQATVIKTGLVSVN